VLEIAFRPDPRSAEPVYRQLAARLGGFIAAGRLPVGEKLPPTRDLATMLGLSRNTVLQAYLTLADQGLVQAGVGRGTYVQARTPAAKPIQSRTRLRRIAGGRAEPPAPRPFAWEGLLALRARDLPMPGGVRRMGQRFDVDFRGGRVDEATFPARAIARACARALEQHGPAIAGHHDVLGWPPLRDELARRLVARGIACSADDVLVVGGAQRALDLLGRVLLDPGDVAVVEQPGYFGATLAFRAAGAHLLGVGVDGDGLCTDELARLLRTRRAKLVYTTPAVQSPTGVTLAPARRDALRALADAHQVPVIEDDYDSELRLGVPTPPALEADDPAGQIVYLATFSKALFPGARVGYVVAARPLLERLAMAHLVADFQVSSLLQAALVELIRSGALERHVRRVRRVYAERLRVMRAALAASMPAGTEIASPAGGNGLWVTLPPDVDGEEVALAARAAGVAYEAGEPFFLVPPRRAHFMLSFANVPAARIADGVERLARIVRTRRRGGRARRTS
jgi:GntR family transcriptional regulator/MocR family aminotransferase